MTKRSKIAAFVVTTVVSLVVAGAGAAAPTSVRPVVDGSVIDSPADGAADFVFDGLGSVIVGFNAHFGPGEYRGVYEFDLRRIPACHGTLTAELHLSFTGTFMDGSDPRLTLHGGPGDGVLTLSDFTSGVSVAEFSAFDYVGPPNATFSIVDVTQVLRTSLAAGETFASFLVRPNPAASSTVGAFLYSSNEISDAFGFLPSRLETTCEPVPFAPQHFQGYEVGGEEPDFSGENVRLVDRFGDETVYLGDARMLLTPVETRRESDPVQPIQRPEEQLKCYRVTGGKRLDRTIHVSNQFTDDAALHVKEPNRLCAPASLGPDGADLTPPTSGQHYKCYRVAETPLRAEETVELVDRFGESRVIVRRAELFCTPVTKQREGGSAELPAQPEDELVCYAINELQPFQPLRQFTLDEFGLQSIQVFDQLVLCVPSRS